MPVERQVKRIVQLNRGRVVVQPRRPELRLHAHVDEADKAADDVLPLLLLMESNGQIIAGQPRLMGKGDAQRQGIVKELRPHR